MKPYPKTMADIYLSIPMQFDKDKRPMPPISGDVLLALEQARAIGRQEGIAMCQEAVNGLSAHDAWNKVARLPVLKAFESDPVRAVDAVIGLMEVPYVRA